MPSELRHLLFRPAEVVQAVKEYHRRTGKSLPAGSILGCGPECAEAGGIVVFRITVAADGLGGRTEPAPWRGERQEVVIEGPALTAALILHCRERRIPLPAQAEKSLQRFGEQLCLVLTINPKGGELPQVGQLRL